MVLWRRITRAKRSGTALALQHGLTSGLICENFSPETAWEPPKNYLLTSSNVYGSRDQEPAETNCRYLQTASAAKHPDKLALVEEFIVKIEGPAKNSDVTRWGQFTDIKKEMFQRFEIQFENWLNP
jgi:hypothetical protein